MVLNFNFPGSILPVNEWHSFGMCLSNSGANVLAGAVMAEARLD